MILIYGLESQYKLSWENKKIKQIKYTEIRDKKTEEIFPELTKRFEPLQRLK